MKNNQVDAKIIVIATAFLSVSIVLMIAVIPGIYYDTSPRSNPSGAATAISIALLIRLAIFLGYLRIIWQNKRAVRKKKGGYLAIGFLVIVLGLIYMDGAFAFLSHDDILYVSIFMFAGTFCDLVAGILTIIAFFKKPHKAA